LNKQQLAAKIWESANQMRSKIEANEYKDYILGFIFYKYLSDQLVQFAKAQGMSDDEIKALSESDEPTTRYIQKELGYFIGYDNLFSTWLSYGNDFNVSDVRDALSTFEIKLSLVMLKPARSYCVSPCSFRRCLSNAPRSFAVDMLVMLAS